MANTLFNSIRIFGELPPVCSIMGLVNQPFNTHGFTRQGAPLLPSGNPVKPLVEIRALVKQDEIKPALMLLLDELDKRQAEIIRLKNILGVKDGYD